MQKAISPRAPAHHHLPAVALLGLLLILTVSHVYLQLAYPLHGAGLNAGIFLLAAVLLLSGGRDSFQRKDAFVTGAPEDSAPGPPPQSTPLARRPDRLLGAALALQGAWALWAWFTQSRAPVASIGRMEFSNILLGFFVFWIAAESARRWASLPLPEGEAAAPPGERASLSAEAAFVFWGFALAMIFAGYGIYQVHGPENWPNTFASLRAVLHADLAARADADRTAGGILHALREGRAFGTFGAPNMFGGFLAFGLALGTAAALGARSRGARWAAWAGAALTGAGILASQSRGGMIAACVAAGWVLARSWTRSWREGHSGAFPGAQKATARGAVQTGLCLFLSAMILKGWSAAPGPETSSAGQAPPAHRAGALDSSSSGGLAPSLANAPASSATSSTAAALPNRSLLAHIQSAATGRQRLYYWKTAAILWRRSPWLGNGWGAFEVFYPGLRLPGAGETIYAHNLIMQWGCESGAIGLILFLAALGACGAAGELALRRARRHSPGQAIYLIALQAGALALLAHGLVDYTLSERELYLDLLLLLGLQAGACGGDGAEEAPAGESAPCAGRADARALPARPRWIIPAMKTATVLFFGVLLVQETLRPMIARFYLSAARDNAQESGRPAGAKALYAKALNLTPDDPWALSSMGLALLDEGNTRGLDMLLRAANIHPYSASIQMLLASAYDRLGSSDAALMASRKAVALHPLDPEHRMALAERLLRRGQKNSAREYLAPVRPSSLYPAQLQRLDALLEQTGRAGGK